MSYYTGDFQKLCSRIPNWTPKDAQSGWKALTKAAVPLIYEKYRGRGSRGIWRCLWCSCGYSFCTFPNRWEKIPLSWISALPGGKQLRVLPTSCIRAAQQGGQTWGTSTAATALLSTLAPFLKERKKKTHHFCFATEIFSGGHKSQ